jgi:hypothetical protein
MSILSGIGDKILLGGVGLGLSWILGRRALGFFRSVKSNLISNTRRGINGIKNKDLRIVARHMTRYVASTLPNISEDEQLQLVIAEVQRVMPDILISDKDVKSIIETIYQETKYELENI